MEQDGKKGAIRVSRAVAEVMREPSSRKGGAKAVAVLLALAILGMAGWWTRGLWLPYAAEGWAWFLGDAGTAAAESPGPAEGPVAAGAPLQEEAAKAAEAEADRARPDEPAAEAAARRPARDWSEAPLAFVSPSGWGDEAWLAAVKAFNQALEKYRDGVRAGGLERGTLDRIAQVADQAGERFAALADAAPGHVDVSYAAAMAKMRSAAVAEVVASAEAAKAEAERARLARLAAEAAAAAGDAAPAPETAVAAAADPSAGKGTHDRAAEQFNEALKLYRSFLADKKSQEALLPRIEELAFSAAKGFEAARDLSNGTAPKVDEAITQCYRLVSDCRRQTLDGAGR